MQIREEDKGKKEPKERDNITNNKRILDHYNIKTDNRMGIYRDDGKDKKGRIEGNRELQTYEDSYVDNGRIVSGDSRRQPFEFQATKNRVAEESTKKFNNSLEDEDMRMNSGRVKDRSSAVVARKASQESDERVKSAFQSVSQAKLNSNSYGRTREPQNEFYEKNFGANLDRKVRLKEVQKEEIKQEIQNQIIEKKERERQERDKRIMEDMRAEERYLSDLKRLQEAGRLEAQPRANIFADEINDEELSGSGNYNRADVNPVSGSLAKKQEQVPSVPIPNNRDPDPERLVSKRSIEVSRSKPPVFANDPNQLPGESVLVRFTNSQEFRERPAYFADSKLDQKKKELRVNTSLLFQQLMDLRVASFLLGGDDLFQQFEESGRRQLQLP
jgi:hypothetical protein